jgi:hypothetical protein
LITVDGVVVEGGMTEAIQDVFAGRRCMGLCGRSRSDEPEAEMLQNGFDDLPILDGADDSHGSSAFRANERIDLINVFEMIPENFESCPFKFVTVLDSMLMAPPFP